MNLGDRGLVCIPDDGLEVPKYLAFGQQRQVLLIEHIEPV